MSIDLLGWKHFCYFNEEILALNVSVFNFGLSFGIQFCRWMLYSFGQSWMSNLFLFSKIRDMGHGIWDMGHGTWNMGHGMWDMGY